MTDFDPDAYLAQKDKEAPFDPDAYLSSAPPEQTKTSAGEAGLLGAIKGLSANYIDELAGGLEALGSQVGLRGLGGSLSDIRLETPEEDAQSFADVYAQARDLKRAQYAKAREEQPTAFGAGEIGGGLVSGLAVPGAAATGLKSGVALGAGLGAAQGFGAAEGDKWEQVKAALASGALGAGAGALGAGIGAALKPTSKAAMGQAERSAYAATGGMKSDINKLYNRTPEDVGRELLDRGLIKLGTKRGGEALSEGVESQIADFGQRQKALFEQVSKSAPKAFDLQKTVDALESAAEEASRMAGKGNQAYAQSLRDEVDIIKRLYTESGKLRNISPSEALDLKRQFDKASKFQSPMSEANVVQASREARSTIKKQIDETLGELVQDPALVKEYAKQREGASRLMSAKSALEQSQQRAQSNKALGLTDLLGGTIGATAGSAAGLLPGGFLGVGAGIAANKLISNYGASTTAVLMKKTSEILAKEGLEQGARTLSAAYGADVAGNLVEAYQEAKRQSTVPQQASVSSPSSNFSAVSSRLPPKYQQSLQAGSKGEGNRAAVNHYLMYQQDPQYRQEYEKAQKDVDSGM